LPETAPGARHSPLGDVVTGTIRTRAPYEGTEAGWSPQPYRPAMAQPATRFIGLRALVVAMALAVALAVPALAATSQRTDVAIGTASYQPSLLTLAAAGDRVRWTNTTSPSRVHDVVSSLPDYFHMPLGGSGSRLTVTFQAAGYFTYFCSIHDTMLGAVSVPLTGVTIVGSAGTSFRVRVASVPWPSGSRYVSVVFLQGPGDSAPRYWHSTRRATLDYAPTAPGEYSFTARVKDTQTHRLSGATQPLTFTFAG
jgi:plastocyanin